MFNTASSIMTVIVKRRKPLELASEEKKKKLDTGLGRSIQQTSTGVQGIKRP
jgi:hypothetical protein